MAKINRALKRTRKVTIKSGTMEVIEDKAIKLQHVYTAARGKDEAPVIADWHGVLYQHFGKHRWLLSKNPSRTAAFAMDAEKVFPSRTAALNSLNMKKCYYVDAGKVVEGKMYRNGLGAVVVVSIDGWFIRRTRAHVTRSAARKELVSMLRKDVRRAQMMLNKADRALREETKRK